MSGEVEKWLADTFDADGIDDFMGTWRMANEDTMYFYKKCARVKAALLRGDVEEALRELEPVNEKRALAAPARPEE